MTATVSLELVSQPPPRPAVGKSPWALIAFGLLLAVAAFASLSAELTDARLTALTRDTRAGKPIEGRTTMALVDRVESSHGWFLGPGSRMAAASLLASVSAPTAGEGNAAAEALTPRILALAVRALVISPAFADAHLLAGAALTEQNTEPARARRHLARAAALDPQRAALRRRIGIVHLAAGDARDAADEWRTALALETRDAPQLFTAIEAAEVGISAEEITPPRTEAFVALGTWREEQGDTRRARAAFANALALADAGDDFNEIQLAYRRLDEHLLRVRDYDAAIDLATARLDAGRHRDSADRAALLAARGQARLRAGRAEASIADFADALSLAPDRPTWADLEAQALAACGRHAEAAAAWSRALALPRRDDSDRRRELPMRVARARSLAASGDRGAALEEVKQAVLLAPSNEEARALARELLHE